MNLLTEIGELLDEITIMPDGETIYFRDVLADAIAADDSNVSSYARRIGWSPTTLSNYLGQSTNRTSPAVELLLDAIRARRMPANLHLRLLLLLADGQYVISAVPSDFEDDQARDLRLLALDAQRDVLAVSQVVHDALVDGRVDGEEARSIELAVMRSRNPLARITSALFDVVRRGRGRAVRS